MVRATVERKASPDRSQPFAACEGGKNRRAGNATAKALPQIYRFDSCDRPSIRLSLPRLRGRGKQWAHLSLLDS